VEKEEDAPPQAQKEKSPPLILSFPCLIFDSLMESVCGPRDTGSSNLLPGRSQAAEIVFAVTTKKRLETKKKEG